MLVEELESHIEVMKGLDSLHDVSEKILELFLRTIRDKGKIFICGNGGSAADAQHFAAELVGRFKRERRAWPALALTTDTSILTAVGNDYGYEEIFARQVEGLAVAGDVLLTISTSGNSKNLENAVVAAQKIGLTCVGLLGKGGGRLTHLLDLSLIVPSEDTPRIQEAHIFLLHYFAGRLEDDLGEISQ